MENGTDIYRLRHSGGARYGLLLWLASLPASLAIGAPPAQLADCPDRPNCVGSQASDPGRQIEPIRYTGSMESAMRRMLGLLRDRDDVRIVLAQGRYLKAEYTSSWFGFVDDVELLFQPDQNQIALRSASREGYWDFGANRRRLEALREAFSQAAQPQ